MLLVTLGIIFSRSSLNLVEKESVQKKEISFSVLADKKALKVGQSAKARVVVDPNMGSKTVIATALLRFDPAFVQIKNVTGGEEFTNHLNFDYDNQAGEIRIKQGVAGGQRAVASKATFAEIEFVPMKAGQTSLRFDLEETSAVSEKAKYLTVSAESLGFEVEK